MDKEIINWLLEGDVSIQYQVQRDLLGKDMKALQGRIAKEGWGRAILSKQHADGHWGQRFYQPKWISTHYTLLDLRHLNLSPDNSQAYKSIQSVLRNGMAKDGGIQLGPSTSEHSDICVDAMFLNYASYFKIPEIGLRPVVDCILNEIMPDGGFNCQTERKGALHSSLHTTISVLEGLTEFQKAGHLYRQDEVQRALRTSAEFILMHRLFRSDHSGEIIQKDFLKLCYPSRWKYDVLRAMDYFQYAGQPWDERMKDALDFLLQKRNKDGTWSLSSAHPGKVHVVMEQAGRPSRWNTLRALRVLKAYGTDH